MRAAVVYWSGTGNTEAMAGAVAEGAAASGARIDMLTASEFDAEKAAEYDAIAFGCPAMGGEALEEDEFQPMFDAVKGALGDKSVVLFGSYGWGDGRWMRAWEEECASAGITLAAESVICCEAPDNDALEACAALGAALVK